MRTKTRKQRFRELQTVVCQGLNAAIIELAQDYLRDFPTDGLVWVYYGRALADFSRYKEAKAALLNGMKYMPSEGLDLAYSSMGHVYDGQGNNHRAAEWYKKAVEASPKQARNLNFLGDSLAKLGKISEAENCFRKATRCKEGPVDEAYYNLGVLLGAQGRYKMALVCFEKAVGLDPNYKFAKQGMNDMSRVLQIKGISNNPQQRSAKEHVS